MFVVMGNVDANVLKNENLWTLNVFNTKNQSLWNIMLSVIQNLFIHFPAISILQKTVKNCL